MITHGSTFGFGRCDYVGWFHVVALRTRALVTELRSLVALHPHATHTLRLRLRLGAVGYGYARCAFAFHVATRCVARVICLIAVVRWITDVTFAHTHTTHTVAHTQTHRTLHTRWIGCVYATRLPLPGVAVTPRYVHGRITHGYTPHTRVTVTPVGLVAHVWIEHGSKHPAPLRLPTLPLRLLPGYGCGWLRCPVTRFGCAVTARITGWTVTPHTFTHVRYVYTHVLDCALRVTLRDLHTLPG